MRSWTDDAAEWLQEQIKAHPEMDKKELRRWCSKNYPYSQKRGWAYKAWLKALRAYFDPQSIQPKRNGSLHISCRELEDLGQQRLID